MTSPRRCNHPLLVISMHPGFIRRGWMCMNCGAWMDIRDQDHGEYRYGIAGFLVKKRETGARKRMKRAD